MTDEKTDYAKENLDLGLDTVDLAANSPSHTKTAVQQQAQLHLLSSLATSVYEMRTAIMEALEVLAQPQMVTDQQPEDPQCPWVHSDFGRCSLIKHELPIHATLNKYNMLDTWREQEPVSDVTKSAHRSGIMYSDVGEAPEE